MIVFSRRKIVLSVLRISIFLEMNPLGFPIKLVMTPWNFQKFPISPGNIWWHTPWNLQLISSRGEGVFLKKPISKTFQDKKLHQKFKIRIIIKKTEYTGQISTLQRKVERQSQGQNVTTIKEYPRYRFIKLKEMLLLFSINNNRAYVYVACVVLLPF